MTDHFEDPRDAAVRRYQERTAEQEKQKAEQEAARRERDQKVRQLQQDWSTRAVPAIKAGVNLSNDAFAKRGVPFTIVWTSGDEPRTLNFKIQKSGEMPAALFAFSLQSDGSVEPAIRIAGVTAGDPVLVTEVTAEWAEKIADAAMIAVLDGRAGQIPGARSSSRGPGRAIR